MEGKLINKLIQGISYSAVSSMPIYIVDAKDRKGSNIGSQLLHQIALGEDSGLPDKVLQEVNIKMLDVLATKGQAINRVLAELILEALREVKDDQELLPLIDSKIFQNAGGWKKVEEHYMSIQTSDQTFLSQEYRDTYEKDYFSSRDNSNAHPLYCNVAQDCEGLVDVHVMAFFFIRLHKRIIVRLWDNIRNTPLMWRIYMDVVFKTTRSAVQEARKHERENGEENSQNRELFHRTLVRERTLCPVDLSKEQTPLPDGGLLVSIRAHRNYLARNAESRLHPLRAGFAIDGTYGSDYRPIAREVRRSYRAKLKYACAALVLLLPAALMLAYILGGQSQMKENQVNASPLPDDIHDVVEKWLAIKQETVKSDGTLENISQATIDARLADRMGCSSQTLEAYIDFHSQSSNSLDRAYAALLKNDEEKATKSLMSNMEQEMSVVRKLSIKAKLHAAANRYEDAIKDIHTILALLNEEKQPVLWAKAKYNLGYAYFLTGNFPMAKGSWEHALTMR
ncbi:MAG: tetratricopeptide repeat protein, partial [Akkermansiaceae bacterium]